MASSNDAEAKKKSGVTKGSIVCGFKSPGPKYELKTLVGYNKHCISKHRGPSYSFGVHHLAGKPPLSPGPKYLLGTPKRNGYTFGIAGKIFDTSCGPGPKYILPSPRGVAFSIKFKTNPRKRDPIPAGYYLKHQPDPAFSMGVRIPGLKCDAVPGPYLYSDHAVKPRAPKYSIAYRHPQRSLCIGPGPIYDPKLPRLTPIYSFGVKHSECAPPYIVECDDKC